jgi:hypothetical protein
LVAYYPVTYLEFHLEVDFLFVVGVRAGIVAIFGIRVGRVG